MAAAADQLTAQFGRTPTSSEVAGHLGMDASAVEAVNEDVHRAGGVVPFRFGTVFPDRAALEDWLGRNRPELERELARLRGKAEWGVEIVTRAPEVEAGRYLGVMESMLEADATWARIRKEADIFASISSVTRSTSRSTSSGIISSSYASDASGARSRARSAAFLCASAR